MVHSAQSSISFLNASLPPFGFVMRRLSLPKRWQIAALYEADPGRLNGRAQHPTVLCGRTGMIYLDHLRRPGDSCDSVRN